MESLRACKTDGKHVMSTSVKGRGGAGAVTAETSRWPMSASRCEQSSLSEAAVQRIRLPGDRDHLLAQRIRHRQTGRLHQFLQLRALGNVHAVRDHHDGLRSLSNNLSDGGAELRRRAGDDAQRNKVQRGASALGASPEHGM